MTSLPRTVIPCVLGALFAALPSTQALELDSRYAAYEKAKQTYLLVTAGISERLSAPKEAESLFKQALAIDSTDVYALGGLAELQADAGHFEEARDYCEQVLALSPHDYTFYQGAAMCYFKLGLLQKVDECLSRAQSLGLVSAQEARDFRNHTGPWASEPEGDYIGADGRRRRTIHLGRSPTNREMLQAVREAPPETSVDFVVDYWRPASR